MKKTLAILAILTVMGMSLSAQCDKKITWTASKAEFRDTAGNVQDTKEVQVIIHTGSNHIVITHSDEITDTLQGTIRESACRWQEPYKEGKSVFKGDFADRDGNYMNSSLTIEGKDSKISMFLRINRPDGSPLVIYIPVDSYKEE